jgi:uncharacterized protein with von Willebrand factor type A (vWA) domain
MMTSASLPGRILDLAGVLRRAGVAVGSGEALLAVAAAEAIGVERAADLREALATTLLRRYEDRAVFDAAFQAIMIAAPAADDPGIPVPAPRSIADPNRRITTALTRLASHDVAREPVEVTAILAASDAERLSHRDFEQMSAAEARAARDLLRQAARWWRRPVRRWQRSARPVALDARRTLCMLARNPDAAIIHWRARREHRVRLVLVCDVSGSMHAYSRAFLQLAHALAGRDRSVELFVFATRLTRLSHLLRTPDADLALARIGTAVQDWDSGTRIGSALSRLTRSFGHNVLGSNTIVVLLTDGLERGTAAELRAAATRLKLCCRDVLWINPLLRFAEYAPLARGAAVLAEVFDAVRPAHDPASLAALVRSLDDIAERAIVTPRRPRVPRRAA